MQAFIWNLYCAEANTFVDYAWWMLQVSFSCEIFMTVIPQLGDALSSCGISGLGALHSIIHFVCRNYLSFYNVNSL